MDDKQETIGLSELLNEIQRDLDAFRKNHAGDYSVKNIALWWELESERLLTRHNPLTVLRKLRKLQNLKRVMLWFSAGCVTMIAIQAAMKLLMQ